MIAKTSLEKLKNVLDIQTSDGNWNVDPYMFGMANGLILAYHIMTDSHEECPYLNQPEKWLSE